MTVLALCVVLLAGCGAGPQEARGVVVDVQGDLITVESFTIRTEDRRLLEFVPRPGLRFHEGPLSHLRDHLISGEPVVVRYESEGGSLVASEVSDG